MARESWESVAKALAERMVHQANNCPAGYNRMGEADPDLYGPVHDPDVAAAECPFCADTVAYRRFLARRVGLPYSPDLFKRPAKEG